MTDSQDQLDLDLWLDSDLVRRQNLLKRQFVGILEEVANAISNLEMEKISQRSRGAKIAKGNDLLGLPYQVLDLIRDFDSFEGVNIRLLNWFGNGFFITILMGKNRESLSARFLEEGFSFGLSENKWDYPDLILNKNQTNKPKIIEASDLGFHLWIKPYEILTNSTANVSLLQEEVKKILGILWLPSEQSRN